MVKTQKDKTLIINFLEILIAMYITKENAHKRKTREILQLARSLINHARRGGVAEAHSVLAWAMMLFFIEWSGSCFMRKCKRNEVMEKKLYICHFYYFYPIHEEWGK